ncbi:HPr family phosphocarrier protein [Glycomyces sp. NRRL B-16210]|uniref:HPr family phosphocarrier protein n=1 Tax=Glycomyces sp. NRRL B-16210 TaxID=1463821 RepID=UPI000690BBD7|nr:HPr family phosphocarrier protein [Glycomyces sp. NRRL B-16210]
MAERRVKVTTEVGIQARPATVFVETAAEAEGEVTVAKPGGESYDARSILQVLTLDVRSGDEIVLESDDERILERLVALVSEDGGPGGMTELVELDEPEGP